METTWPDYFTPEVVGNAYGGGRLSSYCIALEAWRRDLQVSWSRADLRNYIVSDGEREVRFNDSRPQSLTRRSDYAKLIDKWTTKRHLEKEGVPVPKGVLISNSNISDEALDDFAAQVGYPLVIKPNTGTMGQGVFSNIRTRNELLNVFRHLASQSPDAVILMEQHVSGGDYRVMVVGDRAVAAVHRIPANVIGDGRNSIRKLIEQKNKQRASNPFLSKGLIKVDFEVETVLAEQGVELTDIPKDGTRIALRRVANASAGGDVEDVTGNIPPGMAEAAVRATQAVPNIHIAGVDFLYDRETDGEFVVIEMNSRPHIPVHMYPTAGQGQDVPRAMIDYFFPDSSRKMIPGDASLNFDLAPVASVLRTRRARLVTLPNLPRQHLPARRTVFFTGSENTSVSRVRAIRLEKRAGLEDVSGTLERDADGTIVARLGAVDDYTLEAFSSVIGATLGVDSPRTETWEGPLTFGFKVAESLISLRSRARNQTG